MKLGAGLTSDGGWSGGGGSGLVTSSGPVAPGAMPGAKQFTIPAGPGPRPQCPPGYHTSLRQPRGTVYPYAICTPLPQPIPISQPVRAPQPAPKITVSPTFQQQFTPQFSPTMQQQQDSPGAVQTAVPTQTATTPQRAETRTEETTPQPTPIVTPPPVIAPAQDTELTREIFDLFRDIYVPDQPQETPPVIIPPTTTPAVYDQPKVAMTGAPESDKGNLLLPLAIGAALLLLS